MNITRTVNGNKRYYLNESLVDNADSFLSTMKLFNLAKIDLYNQKFDFKFNDDGILKIEPYSKFLKDKYHVDAYYQASICSAANGQLSSQTELQKFYKKCYEADIKTRQEKIKKTEEDLVKKQGIKESLVIYAKTGKWVKPYPKC